MLLRGEKCIARRDERRRDGTGRGRSSIKTASLRSLASVRLQRLSRKSSGCRVRACLCTLCRQRNAFHSASAKPTVSHGAVCYEALRTASRTESHLHGERRARNGTGLRGDEVFANLHSNRTVAQSSHSAFGRKLWPLLRIN